MLSGGRLTAAFSVLDNAIIAYPALRQFVGELERLRQGYGYMSGYALQGLPDPGLAESYADIVEGVRTLVEAMARQMRLKDAPTLYFNTLRYELATPGDSVATLVDEYRNVSQKISLKLNSLKNVCSTVYGPCILSVEQMRHRCAMP